MKKLFYVLVGILVFMPLVVFADMGAPMVKPYKASVSNPDGASIYEYSESAKKEIPINKKIPYGTVVEVSFEYNNLVEVSYDDETLQISIKDIVPIEKEYNVSKSELGKETDAIILKSVEIKKGPADAYESTGTSIPKGTKIVIKYFGDDNGSVGNPWAYVEYKDVKGFINTLNASVAFSLIEENTMINKNTVIKDTETKTTLKNIKANTKIKKNTVYQTDMWSGLYYITYDGVSGYVEEDNLSLKNHYTKYTTKNSVDLHETADRNSKVIGSVQGGVEIVNFYDNSWNDRIAIYYEDTNQSGWIFDEYDSETSAYKNLTYERLNTPVLDEDETIIEDETEETPEVVEEQKTNNNPRKLVITCLVVSVCLCLTGLVCLILANKKRNSSTK